MFHADYIKPERLINNNHILELFKIVEKHGGVLRFVGGAVRDAIAGLERADIDLVTDMSPAEFSEMCDEENIKCVPIGIQFFSLGVVIHDNFFKVTCLSSDDDNSQEEWKKDAAKRDLTINAVYADEKGNVFDYYNGVEDLQNGVIKFIGKPIKCIEKNPIRIMRFFRFCAMFGKKIDKKSLKCCIENKHLLHNVSQEKIKEELFKIIVAPYSVRALELVFKYGVLDFMIAPPKDLKRLEKLDNLVEKTGLDKNIIRRIFILFEPTAKRADRLSGIFRLNGEQKEYLHRLCCAKIHLKDFKDSVSINKILYAYGKDVCRDIFLSFNLDNEDIENIKKTLNTVLTKKILPFPLTGKDMIKLGAKEKDVGLHLEILKQKWFESGCILTKKELADMFSKDFKYSV